MLYDDFDRKKKEFFFEYFEENADIVRNLNPNFVIREYQKIALGRFFYYLSDKYKQEYDRPSPIHLMFNMATGSGKTLIMAASILRLYQQGYRNFIFFTRLGNIIQKTKANFLDQTSSKYLFAPAIIIGGERIQIREVTNFEAVTGSDINIIFSTTALLHSRLNTPRENAVTYADFADQKVVLIADEAHNLSTETNARRLNKTEEEERSNWEKTVMGILRAGATAENILLEFTATARLEEQYPEILAKYQDKAIFRYDLKEYRLDKFSKEVSTLEVSAPLMERVLTALVISQYRLKVAQKYRLDIKPVIMFKANRVTANATGEVVDVANLDNPQIVISSQFKDAFHQMIGNLTENQLAKIVQINEPNLQRAFAFFRDVGLSLDQLATELKLEFSQEKCLTVDDDHDLEQKQLLLNSLEDQNNSIRAIFATEKLNEGWDVLNLFDIVRLYDSRDARNNRPGKTTLQEAQLIGRGARYCPFIVEETQDQYTRKYDQTPDHELRILEELFYHSTNNPKYIQELRAVLVREGIMPSRTEVKTIVIKEDFKKTPMWKKGVIYLNKLQKIPAEDRAKFYQKVEFDPILDCNIFQMQEYFGKLTKIYEDDAEQNRQMSEFVTTIRLLDLGQNVIRTALAQNPFGGLDKLKLAFGQVESASDFINQSDWLGGVSVRVRSRFPKSAKLLKHLTQRDKLQIAQFVIGKLLGQTGSMPHTYQGTSDFYPKEIAQIFGQDNGIKEIHLANDDIRADETRNNDVTSYRWYAQKGMWGTGEEYDLMKSLENFLSVNQIDDHYTDIWVLRNEQHFKIYSFDSGEGFCPDFVMLMRRKHTKKQWNYQLFIEAKGDYLVPGDQWKEDFLVQITQKLQAPYVYEDQNYRIFGLPFFTQSNQSAFEKTLKEVVLPTGKNPIKNRKAVIPIEYQV